MPVCSANAATFLACAVNCVDCTARTLISLPAKGLPGVIAAGCGRLPRESGCGSRRYATQHFATVDRMVSTSGSSATQRFHSLTSKSTADPAILMLHSGIVGIFCRPDGKLLEFAAPMTDTNIDWLGNHECEVNTGMRSIRRPVSGSRRAARRPRDILRCRAAGGRLAIGRVAGLSGTAAPSRAETRAKVERGRARTRLFAEPDRPLPHHAALAHDRRRDDRPDGAQLPRRAAFPQPRDPGDRQPDASLLGAARTPRRPPARRTCWPFMSTASSRAPRFPATCLAAAERQGVPVVLYNRAPHSVLGLGRRLRPPDRDGGPRRITWSRAGSRRVVFIAGPESAPVSNDRLLGVRNALAARGLALEHVLTATTPMTAAGPSAHARPWRAGPGRHRDLRERRDGARGDGCLPVRPRTADPGRRGGCRIRRRAPGGLAVLRVDDLAPAGAPNDHDDRAHADGAGRRTASSSANDACCPPSSRFAARRALAATLVQEATADAGDEAMNYDIGALCQTCPTSSTASPARSGRTAASAGSCRRYYASDCLVRAATGLAADNMGVTAQTLQTLHQFPDRQLVGEDVIWQGYRGRLVPVLASADLGDAPRGRRHLRPARPAGSCARASSPTAGSSTAR